MEDIIIAGHSVNNMKKARIEMRQEGTKVIAESVAKVLELFESLKKVESFDEGQSIAKEMCELLEVVEVVAGATGVAFLLPYYEEYGRYDSEDAISWFLENNSDNDALEFSYNDKENWLYKLSRLAESMEQDSCAWYSSKC